MRLATIVIGTLALAIGLAGAGPTSRGNEELRKLEGRWRLASVEQNEQRTDLDDGADVIFIVCAGELFFQDNKLSTIHFPDVDAVSTPKLIDIKLEGQGTLEGIYELTEDTWRVCINNASQGESKERPTELSTRSSPNYQLFTFRRENN